jgi:hypothetical protein
MPHPHPKRESKSADPFNSYGIANLKPKLKSHIDATLNGLDFMYGLFLVQGSTAILYQEVRRSAPGLVSVVFQNARLLQAKKENFFLVDYLNLIILSEVGGVRG